MDFWKLILIPIVGFAIGYLTNYIAVKMLFYPRKRVFGFQGVLPARKKVLAKNIAEASVHVLPEKVRDLEKIPFLGEKIITLIKASVEKEVRELDDKELERLILKVVSNELRFITWVGGILGLLIGLVQVGIYLI